MVLHVNSKPLVSVIIPTYNRVEVLYRSIKSVIEQTYDNYEIIVVDDGSIENVKDTVENFNNKINYIRHDINKGAAAARNTGVSYAKGQYIAFQDSDDEWLPEKLEKQIEVFNSLSHKVGVVYSDMWRIVRKKRRYFNAPHIMPDEKAPFYKALDYGVLNIGIQTAIFRKEVFDNVGVFDERLPRLIDLEYFIRVSRNYCFYHINKALVNFYANNVEGRISTNTNALIVARKLILEKYFDYIKANKKLLAKHYIGIGRSLCLNREFEEGEDYFNRAYKEFPKIKKDIKYLSNIYQDIGVKVFLKNDFEYGKKYIIKSLKINPYSTKTLILVVLSMLGENILTKSIKLSEKFL